MDIINQKADIVKTYPQTEVKIVNEHGADYMNNKFNQMNTPNIPMGLTFNDVLLVPQYSECKSRHDVSLKSRFSKNVPLNTPIVSSPMDTVTEWELAREMARNGGLGIIHRFLSTNDQVKQVIKVKTAQAHILHTPHIVSKDSTYKNVKDLMNELNFSTFLVCEESSKEIEEQSALNQQRSPGKKYQSFHEAQYTLAGIVTKRDMKMFKSDNDLVTKVMTPRDKLQVYKVDEHNEMPSEEQCMKQMLSNRVEKLPLINGQNMIVGMVTLKDLERTNKEGLANLDTEGKLYVGAAVGVNQDWLERAKKLVDAGVDVLVLDIANGHNKMAIDGVRTLKEQFDVDVVAGSIASGEGAENLIKVGADGIRCGIGNGSICITRIVAGSGVPQFSALMDTAPVCKKYDIPLISDGGNKNSGNMCKALAIGADCVMLGRLLGGCEESPGQVIYRDGKIQKVFRGMAGLGANTAKAMREGKEGPNAKSFTPEGVEGYIPFAGPLSGVMHQFSMGIRSGMSYSGSFNIKEHQKNARFMQMSASSITESGVHGITKI